MVRISKFLSLMLRHRPQHIGLTLDGVGWAMPDSKDMSAADVNRVRDEIEARVLALLARVRAVPG